jgi:hypothetical protein
MGEDTVLVMITIGCTVFICICVCGVAAYKEYEIARKEESGEQYEDMI